MKKESLKINEHHRHISTKQKKRKQFAVDPNRLELDEYMLGQIKKTKHSIKKLKKEVVELKYEVKRLHDCRDDYLIFQKSKTQDRSNSSRSQVHISKFQRRVFVPNSLEKQSYESRSYARSKESSIMSKSSCNSSRTRKSVRKKENIQSNVSKERLTKKIKQLKDKARIQSTQKRIIKLEVEKKIGQIVEKELKAKVAQQSPIRQHQPQAIQNQVGYQQLLQLLKTNKSIQSQAELNYSPESIKITQFLGQKKEADVVCLKAEPYQRMQSQKTLQSTTNFQTKSSNTIPQYLQQKRWRQKEERLGSETNLLQSSPSIDTPQTYKRSLKLSHCVELKIMNENNTSEEGSGYDGLFGGNHFRSATLQLSFEDRDNPKRRLRELQFQFDQLVRQQLLTSDLREKELLSLTIRSVLNSISEMKDKLAREAR